MLRKGRDLEKVVLSHAVRWHLENRVLVYQQDRCVCLTKKRYLNTHIRENSALFGMTNRI